MSNDIEARDKVILDAISLLRDDLDKKFDEIKLESKQTQEKINNLSHELAKIDGKLSVIEGRVNDISGRVNFQGNWFLLVLTLLVGGMLTLFSKIVFFS